MKLTARALARRFLSSLIYPRAPRQSSVPVWGVQVLTPVSAQGALRTPSPDWPVSTGLRLL